MEFGISTARITTLTINFLGIQERDEADPHIVKQMTSKPTTAQWLAIALILFARPIPEVNGQPIKENLLAGKEVSFRFDEDREIPAAWIQEAISRHVPVNIRNAIIIGALKLQYEVCAQEIAFQSCVFQEPADFSYAVFKRKLILNDSTFDNGANFENASLESNAFFDSTRFVASGADFTAATFRKSASFVHGNFEGEARFQDAHFASFADFREAVFQQTVSLSRTTIDGPAFFGDATFKAKADCIDLHISGAADFHGAIFKADAIFNAVRIDQYAYFGATFESVADFTGIQIGSMANFQGATFKRDANFNSARIGWHAVLGWTPDNPDPPAVFEGEANFVALSIGDQANFVGVDFKKKVTFNGARFGRDALFFQIKDKGKDVRTVFESEAGFTNVHFNGEANFRGALFKGDAFFNRTEFSAGARFGTAVFEKDVSFNNSRFAGDTWFDDTSFGGASSFQETTFRLVQFTSDNGKSGHDQFHTSLDLRGCTYERIQANWPTMMRRLEPYDRQPFTQLEKTLRAAGDDHAADEVYLERQRIERHRKWQNREYESWFASAAYGLIANYGVRPFRLIGVSIALLALGALFFRKPGTVVRENAAKNEEAMPARLSIAEAFAVSLHNFLPVTIPMGADWKPRAEPVEIKIPFTKKKFLRIRPTSFATFVLRIAGWILVPLGVAALSGLLRVSS